MTRIHARPELLALVLASCSSSSPDLCTQAVTASEHVANQLDTCAYGDAGVTSAATAAAIAACKAALTSCSPSDEKILSTQAACMANLSAVSCQWFSEEAMGVVDGGLSQWIAEVAACQPAESLSSACPGLGNLAPAPCGEAVCAPPLTCQDTPSCGQACVCQADADCPADQRCGPTSGCGMACYHPPTL